MVLRGGGRRAGAALRMAGRTAAILLLLGVAGPLPASAEPPGVVATGPLRVHDDLVSASPGSGDTLRTVPDTLRLVFNRAQNLGLASVVLVGPAGEMDLGDLRAHPDSAAVVLVPVASPWAPGPHTVRWRIVGQDGHPVSGEWVFVVAEGAEGVAVPEPVETAGEAGGGPPRAAPAGEVDDADGGAPGGEVGRSPRFGVGSPAYVAVRWLLFGALLGVLGSASYALLVLPLAHRRDPAVDVAAGRRSAATVGIRAAGVLTLAAVARMWAQARAMGDGGVAVDLALLGPLLDSTMWGTGWMLQLAGALGALAGFGWARTRSGGGGWTLVGASVLVLAFTPGLTGHAVGVEGPTAAAVVADGLHVLAAGGWMGGLLVLFVVAVPAARDGESPAGAGFGPVVEAFSLTALGFAALVVVTGVFAGWLHLGSLGAVWGSAYGRTLALKLALLLPLFATGAHNWRRVRPAVSRGDAPAGALRRTAGAELTVAVLVLLVTAVLVATPPPDEVRSAEVTGKASFPIAQESP